jgi:hypothetical protein
MAHRTLRPCRKHLEPRCVNARVKRQLIPLIAASVGEGYAPP